MVGVVSAAGSAYRVAGWSLKSSGGRRMIGPAERSRRNLSPADNQIRLRPASRPGGFVASAGGPFAEGMSYRGHHQ